MELVIGRKKNGPLSPLIICWLLSDLFFNQATVDHAFSNLHGVQGRAFA